MTRPRLLAACGELPWPTDSGHKLVSLNDLRYLSEHFDIDVLNVVSAGIPPERVAASLAALRQSLPAVRFMDPVQHDISGKHSKWSKALQLVRSFFDGVPYIVSKYRNRTYADRLRALVDAGGYAAVMIESTPLSYLIDDVPALRQLPVVFRSHDMLSETIEKYAANWSGWAGAIAARIEAVRTRAYETKVWQASSVIAPVTRRLTTLIGQRTGRSEGRGLMYLPVVTEMKPGWQSTRDAGSKLVLYVGTVHYPPNLQGLQWFVDQVWPRVRRAHADARLRIIGKGGHLLQRQSSSIEILDYVENLTEHYLDAAVLAVPLFSGSGIRLKILEAFSYSIPVVSTTEGYLGLDVVPDQELLVGDAPDTFADGVSRILDSAELGNDLRLRSAQFLSANHGVSLARQAVADLAKAIGGADKGGGR